MTVEEAALDTAAMAVGHMRRIATLANVVQTRLTTADRIRQSLAGRARYPERPLIDGVLRDISEGTQSVLEHAYLTGVERAHDLPRAHRQARELEAERVSYRDATYLGGRVIVELDGRMFHDSAAARDADLDRDLVAATCGRMTVRLGYAQVIDRPCETASRLAAVLRAHGWTGVLGTCPRCAVPAERSA